jgi:DNA repair ATPase RecN
MSNEQGTVTYSIADILGQINQKLEKIDNRLANLEVGQARLEERLSGEIKALDEKLSGQIRALDAKLSEKLKALDEKLSEKIKTIVMRK